MSARTVCPTCGSPRSQPLRVTGHQAGHGSLRLRCADCCACWSARLDLGALRRLDAEQRAARADLHAAYERAVGESVEAFAASLELALRPDLPGADDLGRSPGATP